MRRDKMGHFRYRINRGHDSVVASGLWKLHYEIYADGVLALSGYGQRLEFSDRGGLNWFGLEAQVTGARVLSDVSRHLRPPVGLGDEF